ncbi:hypothetical protein TVAG_465360 [Trichomonas vaginalis G3]|uniref:Uncharacterized protein n=1 Tax=Trichomonas vaginalis (strain ATCC PRA-98 / G3) TaxID=412133 RepID=A2DU01_TRIV3|nr:Ankyrin repeat family [Trichomonas vaginalis G3]EAY16148.1 hypothetical protein TVAG_465360 [Trichomonas vaginalis G3]KAI5510435.1 Ankyrin repeat family [Trichomonas vaginalis G3]|eukprot:XP_001328371.1 hypothetical protein [Trichomonas vaginalis G3]
MVIIKNSRLHFAAHENCKEIAELLILNAQDNINQIPLHFAVITDSKEAACVLISHEADFNSTDHLNSLPLHLVWNIY